MTPLDDDQLARLLKGAASSIEAPPGAVGRILDAAQGASTDMDHDADGSVLRGLGQHRSVVSMRVAASIVVLAVVGLSIASFARPTPSPTTTPGRVATATGSSPLGLGVVDARASWVTSAGALSGASPSEKGLSQQGAISTKLGVVEPTAETTQTRVVATGTISLTVQPDHVRHALSALTALAAKDLGYVASSNAHTSTGHGTSSATIVLRVPESRFQALVAQVQHVGTATSVVTSSSDVTGEYVDFSSRITALEDSRAQYLTIMARASSISDILAIQAQINNIQSQIEQLQGQRNLLANQAAYATLSVSIDQGPNRALVPESGLRRSVHDSIAGFVAGVEWLVRAVGPALFALLCLVGLLLVGRLSWRAARRRMI